MPPRGPTSSPASTASLFSGRTPTPRITSWAGKRSPDFSRTMQPVRRSARNAAADWQSSTVTPLAASVSTMGVVISLSNGGKTWSCNSTTVVAMPRRTKFSTSSSPMKPAPTTTACFTPWSIRALIRSTSCRLRKV